MKNLKITALTLLVALFSSTATQANIPSVTEDVKTQVSKKVSHPGNEEGAVNAQFTVTESGEIQIIEVESQNGKLKTFLSNKLKRMNVKVEGLDTKEVFNLNFIFKKET